MLEQQFANRINIQTNGKKEAFFRLRYTNLAKRVISLFYFKEWWKYEVGGWPSVAPNILIKVTDNKIKRITTLYSANNPLYITPLQARDLPFHAVVKTKRDGICTAEHCWAHRVGGKLLFKIELTEVVKPKMFSFI